MDKTYYVGLDIHKKMITFCMKDESGLLINRGAIKAEQKALAEWVAGLPDNWVAAMEATLFTGWVYDFLLPHARELKVAIPRCSRQSQQLKRKAIKQMPSASRTCFGWA